MEILHHGAVDGVTGSCHQLALDSQSSLLIDCGLFQGDETSRDGRSMAGRQAIDFDISTVKALIVTHVHIDHVGRIPWLLAAGFNGPILCSEPSAKLLPIVLEDAFRLGISRDQQEVERYLKVIEQRIIPMPYKHWFTLLDSEQACCRIRLQRAGHILGSAYVECDVTDKAAARTARVVFSGDLGAPHAPLLPAPKPPYKADVLVLESTYGDRNHQSRANRRERLKAAVNRALADGGTVLIPAFSIGRTQELLYELEDIIHRAGLADAVTEQSAPCSQRQVTDRGQPLSDAHWPKLPIILDSPLASRFTEMYRELVPFWNAEAHQRLKNGRNPLGFKNLLTVDTHDQHIAMVRHLAETARPAIVIAASGMCAGGRIVNYLKAMLPNPRHNVLFVGYQAKGTPGRVIQQYGPSGGYVDLDNERIDIRAGIDTIAGYSAHADQPGLVGFVAGVRKGLKRIHLVHGDKAAKQALARKITERLGQKAQAMEIITSV